MDDPQATIARPKVGLIANLTAGRNRRKINLVRDLQRDFQRDLGGDVTEADDLPALRAAAREYLAQGVDVLAVNGGDGTVQAVVTEVMASDGPRPDLAILPGGTTNMTFHGLHGVQSLQHSFLRLCDLVRRPANQRPHVSLPLMEVTLPDGRVEHCFFLGAGAILKGMEHFRSHVGSKGLRNELPAAISLVRGIVGVARGESTWLDGQGTAVESSMSDAPGDASMLMVASTMDRLLLGLRPWWGEGPDPIHVTALRREPKAFVRRLPGLLRGRAHRDLVPVNGYWSDNVAEFAVTSAEAVSLDGQVFELPEESSLAVRATSSVAFLDLARR